MENNFDNLPKIVINLPHRTDRRDQFIREMQAIKANTSIIFSNGIIDEKPSVGIAKAHLEAMEFVFRRNEYALIMEDDLWFPGKLKTIPHIDECLNNKPKEWDLLLGGYYHQKGEVKFNEHWNKLDEFSGLHFYIINKSAFERIKNEFKCDEHIDKWISTHNFKVFVMNPFCAMQHDGFSDNVKYVTKYNQLYSKRFNVIKP